MIRIIIKHQGKYSEVVETFAAQLGVEEIQLSSPDFLGETFFELDKLLEIRNRIEARGQKLTFIENVPWKMNYKIVYGVEGRDEQIENYIRTIRNMGKAGIYGLGFNFMPNKVWRTDWHAPARGGATASEFDANLPAMRNQDIYAIQAMKGVDVGLKPDRQRMIGNYEYFIKAVMPEAEKAGVRLALHPDDPPIPEVDHEARIFNTMDDLQWAIDTADSPNFGLNLCLGCIAEMPDGPERVRESIRRFVPENRVFHVHFRGVQGCIPHFKECFIDEGSIDAAEIMGLLFKYGYDGPIMDDHCPHMTGDDAFGSTARAYSIGYLKGLIASLR